jgi:hypothetical protein
MSQRSASRPAPTSRWAEPMSIEDKTTVSAYNDLFDNEVYVQCTRCYRLAGTGSSGPTLDEVLAAAQHDCPKGSDDVPSTG